MDYHQWWRCPCWWPKRLIETHVWGKLITKWFSSQITIFTSQASFEKLLYDENITCAVAPTRSDLSWPISSNWLSTSFHTPLLLWDPPKMYVAPLVVTWAWLSLPRGRASVICHAEPTSLSIEFKVRPLYEPPVIRRPSVDCMLWLVKALAYKKQRYKAGISCLKSKPGLDWPPVATPSCCLLSSTNQDTGNEFQ